MQAPEMMLMRLIAISGISLWLACIGCRPTKEQPPRGDLTDGWVFEGCREAWIDGSYVGSIYGTECGWVRKEGASERHRMERSYANGDFDYALESVQTDGKEVAEASVVFDSAGAIRYRAYACRDRKQGYELEVMRNGRILSVYKASESFGPPFRDVGLAFVPKDTELISGVPYGEVESLLKARWPGVKPRAVPNRHVTRLCGIVPRD